MSEIPNPSPENIEPVTGCIKCGSPEFVAGHSAKLCTNCRSALIKYPIPLWVKAFGAGILVLMLVSWAISPPNFKAAIGLSRAEKYEAAKKYIAEQQELQKVLDIAPGCVQASAHLMLVAFYNLDFDTYNKQLQKLNGKDLEDAELLKRLNDLTVKIEGYFPSDSLKKMQAIYAKSTLGVPDAAYANYIKIQPGDVYARIAYALACDNKEHYAKADSLLAGALAIDPEHITALMLRSITKREINQTDSSIYYCNRLLNSNRECTMALSSKARSLLKKGDNKQALELALKCDSLDKTLLYNKATMAIAYHFNKKFKERDILVKEAQRDTAMAAYMLYANKVIKGEEKI